MSGRRPAVLLALLGAVVVTAAAAPASSPEPRIEVAASFARFFGPSISAATIERSVEAGNAQLAASLRRAATGFLGGFERSNARLTVLVRHVTPVGATVARVGFVIRVRSGYAPYAQPFTGAAVLRDGRWQVAWTTACFVAESFRTPCPRPPAGLQASPLPEEPLQARFARPTALGLIRPEALATMRDGSLLIVDALRNQVLRRWPGGRLEVFAGTGEAGFGGDGGPASAAELSAPSALAVGRDGTVYIADGRRIRAVTDGRVRSLPGGFVELNGLALAPGGGLYVATGNSIVRLDPKGTRTVVVKPHGPFDQIAVGGRRYGGFGPEFLALDGRGNVYTFSSGSKTVFEFSPSGTPLRAWQSYANGLAEAPDGSVVVAGHGGVMLRLRNGRLTTAFDFGRNTLTGFPKPGTPGAIFDPDGVAVARDGTIYTDTVVGNGWTNQTALAEITSPGHGHLLTTTSRTLPAVGARGFPATVYPASLRSSSADPGTCPSPAGLHPFSPGSRAAAVAAARHIDVAPLWNGLRFSDRAWWPGVYTDEINGYYEQGRHRVLRVQVASRDPYATAVALACGRALVESSLVVTIGPGVYSDQVSHLFFLDRRGRALLYWQHT